MTLTSLAHSTAALSVFTDPGLVKHLNSFQSGLPHELLTFLRAHLQDIVLDASRGTMYLDFDERRGVHNVLARHSSVRHVQWALDSGTRWSPHQEPYARADLERMGIAAIRHNRPDIVEWLLVTGHEAFDTQRQFKTNLELAIRWYVPGDLRILDLLRAYDMLGFRRGSRAPDQEIGWRQTRFSSILSLPDLAILRWLDQHVPDIVLHGSIMDGPASRGDFEMIRYLHEHRHDGGCTGWAYQVTYRNHRDIWWYMVENRHEPIGTLVIHEIIEARDFESLRHVHNSRGMAFASGEPVIPSCCLMVATERYDLEMVRVLHDELGVSIPRDAILVATRHGRLGLVRYLHDRQLRQSSLDQLPPGASSSTGHKRSLMDEAAACGHLDILKFLHSTGVETCTKAAMDNAAAIGDLDMVKFLHENRTEGCTTWAMDKAASHGHLHVVEFLDNHRLEGCTKKAMNRAARRGHLRVVQFLHEHRREGCSTKAMDRAGSLEVLMFLHTHRREGCTAAAIDNVIRLSKEWKVSASSCATVIDTLYESYPEHFTRRLLPDLLLMEAFGVWKTVRSHSVSEADGDDACKDGIDEKLMTDAVHNHRMGTIRFLLCDLKRVDLLEPAMTAAAEMDARWRMIVGNLVRECASGVDQDLLSPLVASVRIEDTVEMDPLLLEPEVPSWVYHEAFTRSISRRVRNCYRKESPTWVMCAIFLGDLKFLSRLRGLCNDTPYGDDPRMSFRGARMAVIYFDKPQILKWLVSDVPENVIESNLLDEAIYYGNLEIAKWLVANCAEGCKSYGERLGLSTSVWPGHVTRAVFDWILSDEAACQLVDFGSIAVYAAELGKMEWLQILFEKHSDAFMSNRHVAEAGARFGRVEVLEYLDSVGYEHWPSECADIARERDFNAVLLYLDEYHPDVTFSQLP